MFFLVGLGNPFFWKTKGYVLSTPRASRRSLKDLPKEFLGPMCFFRIDGFVPKFKIDIGRTHHFRGDRSLKTKLYM